jgi:hypothetical protein
MSRFHSTRRNFLKATGAASATLLSRTALLGGGPITSKGRTALQNDGPAGYSLTIATTPIEVMVAKAVEVGNENGPPKRGPVTTALSKTLLEQFW